MTRQNPIVPPSPPPAAADGPLEWPFYADDERAAVAEVLASGRVNQWTGSRIKAFELACAARFEAPHAIAVFNGTVAIELALRALGIGPGDEVITTPRSFMATASCISLVGAKPVFADVHPDSQAITATTITPRITPRTRAILPVHLGGWPADMPAIMALAQAHGLKVIEDCAQAHGASLAGRPIGSFGDAAAFSFCQDKIITTGGEGGMVLFRDAAAAEWAWSYKDHGKDRARMAAHTGAGFNYVHGAIGTNWRMIEMQAAIGLVQLAKLDHWIEARNRNAAIWREALSSLEALRLPEPGPAVRHAYYRFYAFIDPARLRSGTDRDVVLGALRGAGIAAFSGSCPEIYREAPYAGQPQPPCPVARRLGEQSLAFLTHPTLDEGALRTTAARAAEIIRGFQAT